MSFWGNITKCQRPINNTCSEYSDGLKLIKEYRPELQKYTTSILGINTLVKYHGLLTILDEYVLTKTGIGDGIHMCGFGFPDTNDCEPSFFTKGVCFNYGYDTELEVISDQEFVWLIEDTCNIYANVSPRDNISIIKHGLKIPVDAPDYAVFVTRMANAEQDFMKVFSM